MYKVSNPVQGYTYTWVVDGIRRDTGTNPTVTINANGDGMGIGRHTVYLTVNINNTFWSSPASEFWVER
jgi:hypothetical protein